MGEDEDKKNIEKKEKEQGKTENGNTVKEKR